MKNSFKTGVAHHAAATTPLAPEKAAIVVMHCDYMLQNRGYLYDFEQALLLRVAKYPPA